MKLFQYAIASIVDANTGFGLHRDAQVDSYAVAEQNGRRIRARSVLALLGSIRRDIAAVIESLRAYRERRRKIGEVVALSDRQLDDIGLNRGDVLALEQGIIDLEQLEARRFENLGNKRVHLYRGNRHRNDVSRHAVNEAIFARAKCA